MKIFNDIKYSLRYVFPLNYKLDFFIESDKEQKRLLALPLL